MATQYGGKALDFLKDTLGVSDPSAVGEIAKHFIGDYLKNF